MNFTVVNRGLSVGEMEVTGVTTSSIVLVGDAEQIECSSIFDTPPESLIIGQVTFPQVPLTSTS
ncbi:MAG TPA: spore gernimation protein GerPD [Bacillales bacterium]|nr:spore gernimation protein GerPD [Bacillales bacterium]